MCTQGDDRGAAKRLRSLYLQVQALTAQEQEAVQLHLSELAFDMLDSVCWLL
ncbi:hypothetical protein PAXINDRAFT_169405 [Paxillus involutus ATCC 200175]|uniref:Unplaced genomic scaffold PAXINscaffold_17, whole genome shotgun sequence n=1 Tax=Paxillus involutus ATCC 200175 TaxID=664439 RepID=A0A0C9U794_PAXIN|nr:hypothetical protein PAXINDRAFT_169405 [Paxillus involutus ATCC 200175]